MQRSALASSGKIGKAFKLTKVSGAYWRATRTMKCYREFMELVGAQKDLDNISTV